MRKTENRSASINCEGCGAPYEPGRRTCSYCGRTYPNFEDIEEITLYADDRRVETFLRQGIMTMNEVRRALSGSPHGIITELPPDVMIS
jgi:uncharacterized OB-fold protein